MKYFSILMILVWIEVAVVTARPSPRRSSEKVLLLNAPAYHKRQGSEDNIVARVEAYAYSESKTRNLARKKILKGIFGRLEVPAQDSDQVFKQALERTKYFAVAGTSAKVEIALQGCGDTFFINAKGFVAESVSVTRCPFEKEPTKGTLAVEMTEQTSGTKAKVFFASRRGFGVISDIADTVLDLKAFKLNSLYRSLLINEPGAVEGMPELFSFLANNLTLTVEKGKDKGKEIGPQFTYITEFPFQLFPFFSSLLEKHLPNSLGPLLMRRLSLKEPDLFLEQMDIGPNADETKRENKVERIREVLSMYHMKKFMLIGNSAYHDPEAYAEAYRKFGEKQILCIWIRQVPEARTEGIESVFKDIPETKWRIFKDGDIPTLMKKNVAKGEC